MNPRIRSALKQASSRLLPGASARLPTRWGEFRIHVFRAGDGLDHVALVRGDVQGRDDVPVRVHSECLTGDAFGSLRCDCRDQLEASLRDLGQKEHGILLYLRQEGRGIGLLAKIRAYGLQEAGLDTIDANEALGFRADERDYEIAARMLEALQVTSIDLLSNNPHKFADLRRHGVDIRRRIPLVMTPNPHNERYLETKRSRSGHLPAPA